ncbi:Hypothetical protein CINCED_3A006812 [Cinara cedri]|uniref:Uncharacterized protein n=1 Tax=Cinara cedri TaxID=506608 RepID=A0A5E4NM53_9HEMI|nr:Hypothetical protein CINCED_3A006812 [Cinara cedri]
MISYEHLLIFGIITLIVIIQTSTNVNIGNRQNDYNLRTDFITSDNDFVTSEDEFETVEEEFLTPDDDFIASDDEYDTVEEFFEAEDEFSEEKMDTKQYKVDYSQVNIDAVEDKEDYSKFNRDAGPEAQSVLGHIGKLVCPRCITKTDTVNHQQFRHYDVMHFLKFNMRHFDLLNEDCYLALLVYIDKQLYCAQDVTEKSTNIKNMFLYYLRLQRIFNIRFRHYLDSNLWKLYNEIKDWIQNGTDENELKFRNTTRKLIEIGMNKGIWYTTRAHEIFSEYRSQNQHSLTIMAYTFCEKNLNAISSKSSNYEKMLSNVNSTDFTVNQWMSGKTMSGEWPAISRQFGTLLLLLPNEFNELYEGPDLTEDYQHNYLLNRVMRPALIDIYQGIMHILNNIYISTCDFAEPYDFPTETRTNVELLVLLNHLYHKVINVTENMHYLFMIKKKNIEDLHRTDEEDTMQLFENYSSFIFMFKKQWESKFQLRCNDEFLLFTKSIQLNSGILITDRRVQPSAIRYYSMAFNDSWTHPIQDETNTNHMKVMLFEFNIWLTILQHNNEVLTAVLKNYEEQKHFDQPVHNVISAREFNKSQMETFKADRMFWSDIKVLTLNEIVPGTESREKEPMKPNNDDSYILSSTEESSQY